MLCHPTESSGPDQVPGHPGSLFLWVFGSLGLPHWVSRSFAACLLPLPEPVERVSSERPHAAQVPPSPKQGTPQEGKTQKLRSLFLHALRPATQVGLWGNREDLPFWKSVGHSPLSPQLWKEH